MGVKILQGETKLGGGKKLQEVKTSSLFIYLFIYFEKYGRPF